MNSNRITKHYEESRSEKRSVCKAAPKATLVLDAERGAAHKDFPARWSVGDVTALMSTCSSMIRLAVDIMPGIDRSAGAHDGC